MKDRIHVQGAASVCSDRGGQIKIEAQGHGRGADRDGGAECDRAGDRTGRWSSASETWSRGLMYMTVADPMVMEAPVYVPCGTQIMASGCMTPIRCSISMGVEAETTVAELAALAVKEMAVMFIENASIQLAGEILRFRPGQPSSKQEWEGDWGLCLPTWFHHHIRSEAAAQARVGIRTDRASRRRLWGSRTIGSHDCLHGAMNLGPAICELPRTPVRLLTSLLNI